MAVEVQDRSTFCIHHNLSHSVDLILDYRHPPTEVRVVREEQGVPLL